MSRSSPRRAREVVLTARGIGFLAVAVALFVLAYGIGNSVFQLAAVLLGALLLVAVVFVRLRKPRVSATRTFSPAIVSAGGAATVRISVVNLSRQRSAAAQWRDCLPWSPWKTASGDLPSLASEGLRATGGGNRAELSYSIRPASRGIYEIGPLLVGFSDPFGLIRGESNLGTAERLVVTPDFVELQENGLGFAAGEGTARLVQRNVSGNDDDLMTREYRSGDALRRVHWRASARHGELMVRQEEQRARPEVRVLIDTRRTGYSDQEATAVGVESETFEWVVRMVASLGVHFHHSGYAVNMVETADAQITGFGNASQWGGQEENFLASLAGIRLADVYRGVAVGSSDQQTNGALFAVLAEPDSDALGWILRQRRAGERSVAFLPVYAMNARTVLSDAGWQCVSYRSTDDPATVWSAVGTIVTRA